MNDDESSNNNKELEENEDETKNTQKKLETRAGSTIVNTFQSSQYKNCKQPLLV